MGFCDSVGIGPDAVRVCGGGAVAGEGLEGSLLPGVGAGGMGVAAFDLDSLMTVEVVSFEALRLTLPPVGVPASGWGVFWPLAVPAALAVRLL